MHYHRMIQVPSAANRFPNPGDLDRLVAYIRARQSNGFVIVASIEEPYGHLGATLADAVLQANNRYEQTVRPRITRIRDRHPSCDTLPGLCRWLAAGPGDRLAAAREFLEWKGDRRARTFLQIVDLLGERGVNSEAELAGWLADRANRDHLQAVRFVGPKTIDYLGILVGAERIAVDRHLVAFLRAAGVSRNHYAEAQTLLEAAAERLGVAPRLLDNSIWRDSAASSAKSATACVPGS